MANAMTGYQRRKWLRRAETIHRKACELSFEIADTMGADADLYREASDIHVVACDLIGSLENPQGASND